MHDASEYAVHRLLLLRPPDGWVTLDDAILPPDATTKFSFFVHYTLYPKQRNGHTIK